MSLLKGVTRPSNRKGSRITVKGITYPRRLSSYFANKNLTARMLLKAVRSSPISGRISSPTIQKKREMKVTKIILMSASGTYWLSVSLNQVKIIL
jgi:hypothetical protein